MEICWDWLVLVLLVVFLTGVVYARLAANRVKVRLEFLPAVSKGETVTGKLSVSFEKKLLFGKIRIYLQFRHLMTGECLPVRIKAYVGAGTEETCRLEFYRTYSGKVVCSVEKIRVYDWAGITYKTVYPDVRAGILVMPEMTEQDMQERMQLQETLDGMLLVPDKRGCDYSELYGIREYRPGDSMKSIHWKLTGRMERLYVKEASGPAPDSVVLFAETIQEKEPSAEMCDRLLDRLYSVCVYLLEMGVPYQVCWYDMEKEQTVCVEVEDVQDIQRVLHKFTGCRQQQGSPSGRFYYEQLQGKREVYYIE